MDNELSQGADQRGAAEDNGVNQSDVTRQAILDAVVRCFAAEGWAGTNMSLVARETGMTRGKIQYYFPVLEDLKYAAIEHLNECARRSYFDRIDPTASNRDRFDEGIDVLWQLAHDPLQKALVEVEAAARTNPELRQRLVKIHANDELARSRAAHDTFSAFAVAAGDETLELGRLFVTVFINGLAAHHFTDNDTFWQERLVAMLKECLTEFWTKRGVTGLGGNSTGSSSPEALAPPAPPAVDVEADTRRREAQALIERALGLLSAS